MAAGNAVTTLLLGLMLTVGGVFLTVLSVVALVKMVQIAEDLRYLRSRTDLSVQRPKSWKNTLAVCLVVSLIMIVVVIGAVLGSLPAMMQAASHV